MKKLSLFFVSLLLVACQAESFVDPWMNRNDELPAPIPQHHLTEEELLENEKNMGIERYSGLKYYKQGSEYYVWGCYEKFETLTIPDTYKDLPVVGIYWQEGLSFAGDTLKELKLGSNMKGLSSSSLRDNSLLTKISIDKENEYLEVIDDVLYLTKANNDSYPISLIWVLPNKIGELNILEGVGPFDDDNLRYATNVISITIPNSMPNPLLDGNYSFPNFSYCDNLQNFNIKGDNENFKIVDGVLYSKDEKAIVAYPKGKKGDYAILDGAEQIHYRAFDGSLIDHLFIGKNIANIEEHYFRNANLNSIECDDANPFFSSYGGCLYSKGYDSLLYVSSGKTDIEIHISTQNIHSIKNENITSLIVPDSVISIDYTFLPKLKTLVFGSGVKLIKKRAFCWQDQIDEFYFKGTSKELANINLEEDNPSLVLSSHFFYSENRPNTDGNYWHYVDGQITKW